MTEVNLRSVAPILQVADGDFARVAANSIEVELFGRRVRVMSMDDLILAKQTLGREKDLLVVKELQAILAKTRK